MSTTSQQQRSKRWVTTLNVKLSRDVEKYQQQVGLRSSEALRELIRAGLKQQEVK
jgi:hypothetical protein